MIAPEKLIALYTAMLKCRMAAQAAGLPPGSEAAYASAVVDLERKDTLHTTRRHSLTGLARNASVAKTVAALLRAGRARKTASEQLQAACASARLHKVARNSATAMAIAADTEAPASAWKSSLSAAARRSLPVVFVSLRTAGQAPAFLGGDIVPPEGMAFGVPIITVDGNDAVAVYRVVYESLTRARSLSNPTLIDCVCLENDGVAVMESFLTARNLLTPARKRSIRARLRKEFQADSTSAPATAKSSR